MTGGRLARLGGFGAPLDRALALMAVVVGLLVATVSGTPAVNSLRERLFDSISALGGAEARQSWPVLVDIDRAALETLGPWPWSRDRLASLLGAVSAAGPKAVGLDILLDGVDTRSPAALARDLARISSEAGLPDRGLGSLSEQLPDGDRMLSEAIAQAPVVLGVALDGAAGSQSGEARPILVQDRFDARGLWPASGLVMPPPRLAEAAAGAGTLALVGDTDGAVRRMPLVAALPGALVASLALELARVAHGQAFLIIDGKARTVRVGGHAVALGHDGMLRLITGLADKGGPTRISAARLLAHDAAALDALKDRVAIVGGSAPQLGGLRAQADGSLLASLDLQAIAYAQIASGVVPRRPRFIVLLEMVAIVGAAMLAAFAARRLAPGPGLVVVGTGVLIWLAASLACGRLLLVLVDPITVPTSAAASFALAALMVASDARRRAGLIRQRFEQHLAPTVVQRIADNPEALRVAGEMREITALFTDVEGFTAMTDRAEPDRLIAALDDYFDGVCRIVVAHGGLVDKIIGDAVHALFNAPFDLPQHPSRALDCAIEIQRFAAEFIARPEIRVLGFGRTRIGVETGPAIVGDVGGERKLDYTAYGNAVNAAARLEQANKETGTAILVGPGAASRIGGEGLMALGSIAIRGRDAPQAVFTPWPADYDEDLRTRFRAVMEAGEVTAQPARRQIAQLALERPGDAILERLAARLAATADGSLAAMS